MPVLPASICIALANPATPYDGDPPALRVATPVLPAAAASAAGFAPAGWKVERSVAGDLKKDGRGDLVVLLKGANPHCVLPTEGAAGSIDTNPRVLLVAFARGAGFTLQLANAAVIPRIDDTYMDDPFDADVLQVRGGVLRLDQISGEAWGLDEFQLDAVVPVGRDELCADRVRPRNDAAKQRQTEVIRRFETDKKASECSNLDQTLPDYSSRQVST